jgi:anti-sigma regulatory factor (Ser/Thr protein kinase)
VLKLLLFLLPLGLDTFAVPAALGRAQLRLSVMLSSFEMVMPIVGVPLERGRVHRKCRLFTSRLRGAGTGMPRPMTDTVEPVVLRLVMPAIPEIIGAARHAVRSHLERFGIESVGVVEVALSEAVTNAVVHGYPTGRPGEIEVAVSVESDAVEVVICDDGVGPPDPDHEVAGLGSALMEGLADCVERFGEPGAGTTVRMRFERELPPS